MSSKRNRPAGEPTAIAQRRRRVAALRVQRYTVREIVAEMAKEGVRCAVGTVHADIEAIEADWRAHAASDIADHKATVNAELTEVKREAWERGDLRTVLSAIRQQRKLLGLDSPAQVQIAGIPGGDAIRLDATRTRIDATAIVAGVDISKLSGEQLDALEGALKMMDDLRTVAVAPGA